jgi:glycosyltransferase involved in cell wall biosynthesis
MLVKTEQTGIGQPAVIRNVGGRPRLLVVTPRFPYPVIGGDRLRIFQMCRELAKDFDLGLASLCDTPAELELRLPNDGVFNVVHRVLLPRWRSVACALLAVPTRASLQVAYYRSAVLRRLVARLAPQYDVLLAHLIRTAPYVLGHGRPAVIEMTDAISLNYERVRRLGARRVAFRPVVYALEAERARRYELFVARRAALSTFVSGVDRNHLLASAPHLRDKTAVFPNGVDTDSLPYAFAQRSNIICFIGNMTTLQNLDAARFFAEEVLPLVRAECPDAKFKVVGRVNGHARRILDRLAFTEVTGAVESVVGEARGSAVGVCPMRIGAGVQNKILEYMALGLPVVASSVGYEGLEARVGRELLVADSPPEFARAVIRLLLDRSFAEHLASAARRHVVAHHSWSALFSPLRERLRALSPSVRAAS